MQILLIPLLLLFSFIASTKIMKGRLFSEMEPCSSPSIRTLNFVPTTIVANETTIDPKANQTISAADGNFQIEVPWNENGGPNGNLTIEAVAQIFIEI